MSEWLSIDTATTWGDYWTILIGGMTAHLPRKGDQIQLERTGPFVPSMVVSGVQDLIVTEPMRKVLESIAGVTGFRPVIEERIVRLDWSKWELGSDLRQLLDISEPEDTVHSGPHDPAVAKEIGELYEVLLEFDGEIDEDYDADGNLVVKFLKRPTRQFDLFKGLTLGGYGVVIGTRHFVEQLPEDCTRWLEFHPVRSGKNKG